MTDKELQDLIRLKNYEQPEEGYFDDFLLEFQQRQRSEMLKTSARGLFVERVKAWFSEFGATKFMPWLAGGAVAYAVVALFVSSSSNNVGESIDFASEEITEIKESSSQDLGYSTALSMEYTEPVDFTSPKPVFSIEETFF